MRPDISVKRYLVLISWSLHQLRVRSHHYDSTTLMEDVLNCGDIKWRRMESININWALTVQLFSLKNNNNKKKHNTWPYSLCVCCDINSPVKASIKSQMMAHKKKCCVVWICCCTNWNVPACVLFYLSDINILNKQLSL